MDDLKEHLLRYQEKYIKVAEYLDTLQIEDVEGTLCVMKHKGVPQFYHRLKIKGKIERIYLPRTEKTLIRKLAEKKFFPKCQRKTNKRLKQFNAILKDFENNELELLYEKLNPAVKEYINPVVLPYRNYVEEWKKEEYIGRNFHSQDRVIYTENGERVRSKSERNLADIFKANGILYKYERPMKLNSIIVYPDFTFVCPITRREIIWEHFGMMDNPEYAIQACRKISMYANNGFLIGERLIVTFENSREDLDFKIVKELINRHLL